MSHIAYGRGERQLPPGLGPLLARTGVRVVTRNAAAWEMSPGDTMAIGTLCTLYRERGPKHLEQVLMVGREAALGLSGYAESAFARAACHA